MAKPPPARPLTLEDVPGAPTWVERLLASINAFTTPTAAALANGLSLRENFAGEVVTVQVTPPDDWVAVTLANGFTQHPATQFGTPAVRKVIDGEVTTRGLLTRSAGAPAAGTLIFTPPDGYAPSSTGDGRFIVDGGGAPSYVEIKHNLGLVYNAGGVSLMHVGGLKWMASDRTAPRWATPLEVRLGQPQRPFPGRPGAVLALRARQTNNPSGTAIVTHVDWTPMVSERERSAAGIRIHRLWGLNPGVAYSVTLLVLPE